MTQASKARRKRNQLLLLTMTGRERSRKLKEEKVEEKTQSDAPEGAPVNDPEETPGAKNKRSVRRKGSRKDEESMKENTPGETPEVKDNGPVRRKGSRKSEKNTPGEAPEETSKVKDKGPVRRKVSKKDEENIKVGTPGEAPGETPEVKDKGPVRRKGSRKDEESTKDKTPDQAPGETPEAKDKGPVCSKGSRKNEENVKENIPGEASEATPKMKDKGAVRRKGPRKDEENIKEKTPGEAPGETLEDKDKGPIRKKCTRKDEKTERKYGVEAPEEPKNNARSRTRPATPPRDPRPSAPTSPERASSCSRTDGNPKVPRDPLKRKGSSDADPSRVLRNTLEKLKVKSAQKIEATKCVNEIHDAVNKHVKGSLDWCKDICMLKTGSHYENVKICESDEFDLMLAVPVGRVDISPFGEDGAFYSVALKRHNKHPLDRFLDEDNTIRACEMLTEFREKVKEAADMLTEFREKVKEAADKLPYEVSVERKKRGCPAVTLLVKMDDRHISLDFVLGLEVHSSSWPPSTKLGFRIDNWLGRNVKMNQKRRPYYLVPKYEGTGTREQDGVRAKDAWRISFSHVEKDILKYHGKDKTCCENRPTCCRKQCLKLLKYLLKKLKEKYPKEAEKLCSYHAKTTLLHACAARCEDSQWALDQLSSCFQQLLQDFETHLRECQLSNFFIPSHNLLKSAGLNKRSGEALARHIEFERNNVFPLFC